MYWTDDEILRSYKNAKGKRQQTKQIHILAELNGVSADYMQDYVVGLLTDKVKKDTAEIVKTIKQDAEKTKKRGKTITEVGNSAEKGQAEAEIAATETKTTGQQAEPKESTKTEQKPESAHRLVVEAVQLRLDEVESCMGSLRTEMEELIRKQDEYLEEWDVLKEWLTAQT